MRREDVELGSRLIPYREGRELQRRVHEQVVAGAAPSTLLLLEHEPVYTVGRRTRSWERPPGDVVEPGAVPVIEVDRGGKTTWHGPGQLTVYPIVRLAAPMDVIAYVRALEAAVMELCGLYGLPAMRVEGRSGVWVPGPSADPEESGGPGAGRGGCDGDRAARAERKVCALGVRVSRGVTLHGIGLNVDPDLEAFSLERIIPCGIEDAGVTSLSRELGRPLATAEPADALVRALSAHLSPLMAEARP
ncbi:lipoyl(octanoyl) transferase LipB [Actinomyces bowdenii]|uniref:Octanoyltransferase n=1 Tax=Actinomyces bowdenii TaxID=131109 RepID=A0A3P1UTW2_9ACTO|nr:lipoyl(octanoyl) transferase LipB [Actinomyces bowdenii]MBO3724157.1 lipoyl(octanoyl) transferase LipB [Actinomyces bowdenii]RRD24800.1 lipoyl(octanoyl) transferase LipB [Actinomyces bowdenii]